MPENNSNWDQEVRQVKEKYRTDCKRSGEEKLEPAAVALFFFVLSIFYGTVLAVVAYWKTH